MNSQKPITGISWPGLFRGDVAAVLQHILRQFEHSQWWSAADLAAHQFRQLNALVEHAVATVPWYREHPTFSKLATRARLDQARFRELPILTRADVQKNFERLKSDLHLPAHGAVTEVFSSGSTGAPVRVVKTQMSGLFWRAVSVRDHVWHRRDLQQKFAAIKTQKTPQHAAYPAGIDLADWGGPTRHWATGPGALLNISAKVHEQVEWLLRQRPQYLLSYPSILHALAQYCREHAVELAPLLELRSMSELLRPHVRSICREVWDVEIKDLYSCEETGYIALQCPASEQMLVQAETVYVEILDQENRPCGPGETGQVVVTPLHNLAMPLIRYAVGDLAVVGEAAKCGRGLPVLERVIGRTRDMLRLPNGAELFPDYQNIMQGLPQVRQFQIIQKTLSSLAVKLVSAKPLTTIEESNLKSWMQQRFGYPFAVSFDYPRVIERTRAGKYRDFISEL